MENDFSMDQGAEGSFQDDSSTLHLSCTLFIFLLYEFHLRSSGIRLQRLGTPGRIGRLRPNAAYCPLLQIMSYWHTATPVLPSCLLLLLPCSQSCVAETDRATAQPAKMRAPSIWLLTEIDCQALLLHTCVLSAPRQGPFLSLALILPKMLFLLSELTFPTSPCGDMCSSSRPCLKHHFWRGLHAHPG